MQLSTCSDKKYLPGLKALLQSILSHKTDPSPWTVHVIYSGISSSTRKNIQAWTKGKLDIQWLPIRVATLKKYPACVHTRQMAYAKIHLLEMIPGVDKLLWIDADTLVLKDLRLLWDTDMKGACLAAAQDTRLPWMPLGMPYAKNIGNTQNHKYFNSGVMLIDFTRFERTDFMKEAKRFIAEHSKDIQYCDQDVFNAFFYERWAELDPRWNRQSSHDSFPEAYIAHYTHSRKPWSYYSKHQDKKLFFDYLDQTPWKGWRPSVPWRIVLKEKLPTFYKLFKSSVFLLIPVSLGRFTGLP